MLALLGEEHRLSNMSWQAPGETSKPLPVAALGARILCEHHNSSLSYLDGHAVVFFSALLSAFADQHSEPLTATVSSGDKLELWLLKACCGAFVSGNLSEQGQPLVREPPLHWLQLLFEGAQWPEGAGLYIRRAEVRPFSGYALGPVYFGEECVGGGIIFAGVEFFVSARRGGATEMLERSTGECGGLVYRPGAMIVEHRRHRSELELEWASWEPEEAVRYRWRA